jgi:hypothetical protein
MKRREFLAAIAALLSSPGRSRAQTGRRRLGFLAVGDGSGQALIGPSECGLMHCGATGGLTVKT